jgi:broad specificity phosphatase PhoE
VLDVDSAASHCRCAAQIGILPLNFNSAAATPILMSTIYLVRHGQACFGADNYDQLSPTGRQQARLLGDLFFASGERIDAIYSGGLQRQRDTAALIAQALGASAPPMTIESAFEEYDGDAVLRTFAATRTAHELQVAGWPAGRHDRRTYQLFLEQAARAWVDARIAAEDLLPWQDFQGGIVTALQQLMRLEGRAKTLIVSTSAGVIGAAVASVLGLANSTALELTWAIHNASITRLMYSPDKVSLSMFNALPHLESTAHRQLITYR